MAPPDNPTATCRPPKCAHKTAAQRPLFAKKEDFAVPALLDELYFAGIILGDDFSLLVLGVSVWVVCVDVCVKGFSNFTFVVGHLDNPEATQIMKLS